MLNCLKTNPLDLRVIPDSTWLPRLSFVEGKNYSDCSDEEPIPIPTFQDQDQDSTLDIISVEETQYKQSIIKEYRKQEHLRITNHPNNSNKSHGFISNDRTVIMEWIISTGLSLNLDIHTLLFASKLFDNLITSFPIERDDMKLYAGSCIFIASKIENEYSEPICDEIATHIPNSTSNEIIATELKILSLFKFNLRFITPMMYIEHVFQPHDFEDCASNMHVIYALQACLYAATISGDCLNYTSETIAYSVLSITYSLFGLKFQQIPQDIITETTQCSSAIISALHEAYTSKNSSISKLFPQIYSLIVVNFSDRFRP